MNFLSLFAGIGGFDLAFERAGMVGDSMVEIDKNAQNILRRHFPNSKLYNDAKEVGNATHKRRSIDLVCGGFPCQDLSIAGKRAGLAGERSGLWFEFARIIDELEPQWVVAENVGGLLSSNKGADFATIIRWLAERGYGVAWRILDAQYFGVAQRRRRVFIVGSLGNGRAAEVLFEREGVSGDPPARRKAGENIAGTVTDRVGGSGSGWARWNETDGLVAPTLDTGVGGKWGSNQWVDAKMYVIAHGQGGAEIVKDGSPSLTGAHEQPIVAGTMRSNGDAHSGFVDADALVWDSAQITSKEHGTRPSKISQPLNTLAGMMVGIRRLTPTECERLQGFPDGWTDGQSDSTRYRQLGNAVAVPVVEWIGRRIMEAE